eukprot:4599046-Prymnesium_polylepis.1
MSDVHVDSTICVLGAGCGLCWIADERVRMDLPPQWGRRPTSWASTSLNLGGCCGFVRPNRSATRRVKCDALRIVAMRC